MSLKYKIFVGFAAIILLLLVNGLISRISLSNLSKEIHSAQEAGETNATIVQLDRDVQELKVLVDRFVNSGNPAFLEDVQRNYDGLLSDVARAKTAVEHELRVPFEEIESHIETHRMQFEKIVEERRIRESLLQEQLPEISQHVDDELKRIADLVESVETKEEDRPLVARSQALFLRAETLFLRYFENHNGENVRNALMHLKDAREGLGEIRAKVEYDDARLSLEQYQQTALRAVQATRSYLYLRNVVMAGEASEIAYYSRRIRVIADEQRRLVANQIAARTNQINGTNILAIICAVVISAGIAARLVFAIVPPVTRLTSTFNELASGKVLEEIPAVERTDEIGEMARAAEVFSQKNQETRRLLEDSERLSIDLKQQAELLEQTNQELDSFAYVASHDLKSPLRGIRQLANWIEEDVSDSCSEDAQNYLQLMQQRVSKMETLLDDLLQFSRVGRMTPPTEDVDVDALMRSVVELTDNPNGVRIRWADVMPRLTAVRPPLEQVFLNLVGNAVKHHDKTEHAFVEVDWSDRGEFVEFRIRDNGPGIEERNFDRIFQMYQRVGSPEVDGTGMGLAIVKKQIEHFGGTVWLESEVGVGTTFFFTWPLRYILPEDSNVQSADTVTS